MRCRFNEDLQHLEIYLKDRVEHMELKTERLYLRVWKDSDFAAFAAMHADSLVMRHYPSVWSTEQSAKSFAALREHYDREGFGMLCLCEQSTDAFVGTVGLQRVSFDSWFSPCIEIGWRLHHDFWSRGYAHEAAYAVLAHAFDSLQQEEIFSFTSPLNTASEILMQRLGMEWVGTFEHPRVPEKHPLRSHVLYHIDAAGHRKTSSKAKLA